MRSKKRFAAILLVMAMILSTTSLVAATATPVLTDIAGHPAETDIKYLVGLEILHGFPDGTFRPDRTLNRAEAVKIILTATGQAELARLLFGASPFTDVPGTHWASGYIALASNARIVQGHGDGTFTPAASITYAQFAAMLVRAAGLSAAPGLLWPANYVKAATDARIITAEVPFFAADMPSTRGDAARMTANAVADVRHPVHGTTLAQRVHAQPVTAAVAVTPAAVTLGAGRTTTLTAALTDAAGAVVTGVPITWTSSHPAIATVVGGVVAAVAPGTATITATAEGRTATVPVTVFGPAAAITLSAPTALVANNVSTTPLTATVVDAGGRRVEDFTGTIAVVSHSPDVAGIVGPATVAAVAGVGTVTLRAGSVVGMSVVAASLPAVPGIATTTTVSSAAQVLTSISLVPALSAMMPDGGIAANPITVRLADQTGAEMLAANVPLGLRVRLTSGAPTLGDFGGGLVTEEVPVPPGIVNLRSRNLLGAVPITGVVTAPAALVAIPVASTSVAMAFVGPPAAVTLDPVPASTVGHALEIRARLRDVNGVQTGAAGVPVTLVRVDVRTGLRTPFTAVNTIAGVATFNIGAAANTVAGEFTYQATSGALAPSALVTGVTSPGTAARLSLRASPSTLLANGVHQSTLTARVEDANGNLVTAGTFPVRFERTVGTTLRTVTPATVSTVGGLATFVVTAGTAIGSDTITASVTGWDPVSVMVTTAVFGAPHQLATTIVDAAPVVGGTQRVNVTIQDAQFQPVTTDNSTVVTLTIVRGGVVQATRTATAVNGVASFSWTQTATGAVTYRATAPGLLGHPAYPPASVAGTTWGPGTPVALAVRAMIPTLGIGGAPHITAVQIRGVDAHGNASVIPAGAAVTITPAPGVLEHGTLAAAVALGNLPEVPTTWLTIANFTSATTVGSTALTVASGGLTSASVTISTIMVGEPRALRIEPITAVTAGGAGALGDQLVDVTVVDVAGNRVTNSPIEITLTPSGSATITTADANAGVAGVQVAAVAGRARFVVRNLIAENVTYTAEAGLPGGAVTGIGTFGAGAIAQLHLDLLPLVPPGRIVGNGSAIATYRVRVVDANLNTVTTAAGTVTFSIPWGQGGDFATVLTPTVPIIGGVGTASVQARAIPVGTEGTVIVEATTTDIFLPGTITPIVRVAAAPVLTVDRRLPTIVSATGIQAQAAVTMGTGANRAITITAAAHPGVFAGARGNALRVEFTTAAAASPLTVSYIAPTITVRLATNSAGDLIAAENTATLIAAAINAHAAVGALVTAAAAGTGADSHSAIASTPFTGGSDTITVTFSEALTPGAVAIADVNTDFAFTNAAAAAITVTGTTAITSPAVLTLTLTAAGEQLRDAGVRINARTDQLTDLVGLSVPVSPVNLVTYP